MTDGDGASVEEGEALQDPTFHRKWVYTATAALPAGSTVQVQATAKDTATNESTQQAGKVV